MQHQPITYDAFISYSHAADNRLAPRLQQSLQRFAKPMWRLWSLRIFRDETSLAATHALPDILKRALEASRYFILLASPAAAHSKWVTQEIQHWLATKGSTSLLIVLTEGEIVWSDANGDFDWTQTTALPKCLAGTFNLEPKWEDLTKIRQADDISPRNPVLQHATASLFCAITGRALDDVIGEDIRVHRRNAQIFILRRGSHLSQFVRLHLSTVSNLRRTGAFFHRVRSPGDCGRQKECISAAGPIQCGKSEKASERHDRGGARYSKPESQKCEGIVGG
jgi:hypothetical protein